MKRLVIATMAIVALFLSFQATNSHAASDAGISKKSDAAASKGDAKTAKSRIISTKDIELKIVKTPDGAKEAIGSAKDAFAAAKSGKWWYFSALAITILMFFLKLIGGFVGFWEKLGRWRYIIAPTLSILAALLATFQGGVSFEAAIAVFTSSYATASLQELWEHGILGKARASAGTAK